MQSTIYEEVTNQIAEDILTQHLPENTDFRDETALMKKYRTSRATIQRAIFRLAQRQLLRKKGEVYQINPDPMAWRKVAEQKIEREARELFATARALGFEDHRTIDLILKSVGQPPAQG